MRKLRVFIVSQEEPFYIPKVIRYLTEHQNENFEIVGATRLQPHRKNKTMKDWLLERTQIYTYWELFITTCFFVWRYLHQMRLCTRIAMNNVHIYI